MAEPKALDFDGYSMWDGNLIGYDRNDALEQSVLEDMVRMNVISPEVMLHRMRSFSKNIDIEQFLVQALRDGERTMMSISNRFDLVQDYADMLSVMLGIGYAWWDSTNQTLFICPDQPVDGSLAKADKIQLSSFDDEFVVKVSSRQIRDNIDRFLQNICFMLGQECDKYAYRMQGFENVTWSDKVRGMYDPLTKIMPTYGAPVMDKARTYHFNIM